MTNGTNETSSSSDQLFWMRRRSEGFLIWHSYKTRAARERWASIYHGRNDAIWMNEDGSTDGLFFLRDEDQWHPASRCEVVGG